MRRNWITVNQWKWYIFQSWFVSTISYKCKNAVWSSARRVHFWRTVSYYSYYVPLGCSRSAWWSDESRRSSMRSSRCTDCHQLAVSFRLLQRFSALWPTWANMRIRDRELLIQNKFGDKNDLIWLTFFFWKKWIWINYFWTVFLKTTRIMLA